MSVRRTSAETYRQIMEEGLLSLRRRQVYDVIYKKGPFTGAQTSKAAKELYGGWGHSETIRNRITELRDMGCVYEVGEVSCPITGRNVLLFDVTENLPTQVSKRMNPEQALKTKIIKLEQKLNELRLKLRKMQARAQKLPPLPLFDNRKKM